MEDRFSMTVIVNQCTLRNDNNQWQVQLIDKYNTNRRR